MCLAWRWAGRPLPHRCFNAVVTTRYRPNVYPWSTGPGVFDPGTSTPRTNLEAQGSCPRVWPTIYRVPAMGLGAMPLYQLGPTSPVFNNSLSPVQYGYHVQMPGMSKLPYGG